MKKKILIGLLVIFVILLVGVIGFGIYLNMNFSTMIFEKGLDKLYSISNSVLSNGNNINYENQIVSMENNLTYTTSEDVKTLTGLNLDTISVKYNMVIDNKNKKMLNSISYLEDNKEFINADLLYNNDKYSYIDLKDIFSKILKVSLDEETNNSINELFDSMIDSQKTIKDTDRLMYLTKEIIKKNLNKNDIVKKDISITIDEKEHKLTEYCYQLENEKLYNFIVNILTEMEKNSEITTILKETYNMEEVNLVESFKEEVGSDLQEKLYISLYVSGKSDIVGFSINEVAKYTETVIKYINVNNYYLYELNNGMDIQMVIEGSKENDVINLNVINNDIESGTIKVTENNGEYTIALNDTASGDVFTIKYKYEKVSDEENKLNLELGIMSEGNSMGVLKYTLNTKVVDKLDEFDYSNAIDVNSLSEDQMLELQTNLQQKLSESVLFNLLLTLDSNNQLDTGYYGSMY